MRDYEEKSYYEIQLDNKQLILVFLAGVAVCVLIFVLGVMVGKGKKEAEIASLSKKELSSSRTEEDVKTPQQAKTADEGTDTKEPKKIKKVKPEKEGEERPAYYDLGKPDSDEKQELTPDPKTEAKVEKVKQEQPAAEPVPDKSVEKEPTTMQPGTHLYTVQVMATASKDKAQKQLDTLKSKGYTAFMDEDKAGSGSVFKVRVGKFDDPDTAKKIATRLKDDLKLETWVAVID